jgi:hypothetical protein
VRATINISASGTGVPIRNAVKEDDQVRAGPLLLNCRAYGKAASTGYLGFAIGFVNRGVQPLVLNSRPIFAVKAELIMQQRLSDDTLGTVRRRATHVA